MCDIINKMVQIVALVLAGVWAIHTWYEKDFAARYTGLQPSIESYARWSPAFNGCFGAFRVTLENIGVKNKDALSVSYTVTPVKVSALSGGQVSKVDPPTEPVGDPATGDIKTLVGTYAPKEKRFQDIPVVFAPKSSQLQVLSVSVQDERTELMTTNALMLEDCKKE